MLRERQSHRLIQIGATLFLLGLFLGLAVPSFTVPRLGLSSHLLAITQGLYLMIAGLVWPRLSYADGRLRVTFAALVGGCMFALTANLLAASWGAGSGLLPIAAAGARGSSIQELIITVVLRAGGVMLIIGTAFFVVGLRGSAEK